MALHTNLLTVDEDITHYPDKKMKKCTLLGADNKKYEADLLPSEVALILEFKRLSWVLNDQAIANLQQLISDFGDERYHEGGEDERMANMGEEL